MQTHNFRQKVLDYLAANAMNASRPFMVGTTAVACQLRIQVAEDILEDLVLEKKLRHVTPAEKKQFDIQQGYVLV
jgi:hypothetical protein